MIQAIKRAFDVVELLADAETLSLKELASLSRMKKTTLCMILKTLAEMGYVRKQDHGL